MRQSRLKRNFTIELALNLLPLQKRAIYSEIWEGDLHEFPKAGLEYRLNAVRTGLNLRWNSWSALTRTTLGTFFGLLCVSLATVLNYRLGDLALATLLLFGSFFVDVRRFRFRRAIEVLGTFYFVTWLLLSWPSFGTSNVHTGLFIYVFATIAALTAILIQFVGVIAVKDFHSAKRLRLFGVVALSLSLPANLISRLFVGWADRLPQVFIQDFHQQFRQIENYSNLLLILISIVAFVFHVAQSRAAA